jgi:hypothetical protein
MYWLVTFANRSGSFAKFLTPEASWAQGLAKLQRIAAAFASSPASVLFGDDAVIDRFGPTLARLRT